MDLQDGAGEMVREPMVEGIFYPAEPDELRDCVRSLLSRSTAIPQAVRAIITPHAGYEFSGQLMADAFKTAAGTRFERIIIVAPCCHSRESLIHLPESPLFRSPIGESRVDVDAVDCLADVSTICRRNDVPHLQEHAIEVQLPFIHYLFPDVRIVPILLGAPTDTVVKMVLNGLAILNSEFPATDLVVVCANLTPVLDQARALREAERAIDLVANADTAGLLVNAGEAHSENSGPLAIAAAFALESELQVIGRGNSLAVHHDPTNVAEYAALAF